MPRTLLEYQKDRNEQLPFFDFLETEQALEHIENGGIDEANKLEENCCSGNLEISLYYEEKISIILRCIQLYAVLLILFYE